MHGGKNAADYKRLHTSNNSQVLAFEREKAGERIIFIAHMADQQQEFTVDIEGSYANYIETGTTEI